MAVVTIDGQIGAGASELGKRIADELGADYYDRLLLVGASRRLGARLQTLVERQRRPPRIADRLWRFVPVDHWKAPGTRIDSRDVHRAISEYIGEAARSGNAVIIHRGACMELRGMRNLIKVGIFAPWDFRLRRFMARGRFATLHEAAEALADRERAQIAYFMQNYGVHPHDRAIYDIDLTNSDIGQQSVILDQMARRVVRSARELADAGRTTGATSEVR
ncbi:MAG: cytidylate kinase-like family protein [Chloroflexi bacterium]|nr:cytidylate kinase-like family protein [Chloroflexota bacterium]